MYVLFFGGDVVVTVEISDFYTFLRDVVIKLEIYWSLQLHNFFFPFVFRSFVGLLDSCIPAHTICCQVFDQRSAFFFSPLFSSFKSFLLSLSSRVPHSIDPQKRPRFLLSVGSSFDPCFTTGLASRANFFFGLFCCRNGRRGA